ncbi:MAG: GGDEF domain-containing protein, partial [Alphaproteobacteria bacterium]
MSKKAPASTTPKAPASTTPKAPAKAKAPAADLTIEKLMKLRTGNAAEHLDSADFGQILDDMIALKRQVMQQEKMIFHLQTDAMADPLTGLANRRAFDEEMQKSLSTAKRYNRTHGLLLIDADNFKSINDNLGHAMGDKVLQHIASLLRQNVRKTDIIARLGGDEFAVILNELRSADNAEARAIALMDIIAKTPCIGEEKSIHIGVSIGHHVFGANETAAE